jgi:SAM-dependent methyltransferase
VDLGIVPPSNAYLSAQDLTTPESYYPLKLKVCDHCWLVQTEDYVQVGELFSHDYAYFSSISQGWLYHTSCYAKNIISRLGLDKKSFVIEIAANDGSLLKNFAAAGIPCLGIEPTASTATMAENMGLPILREFFSGALAKMLAADGKQTDLVAGNNVYGHVPDINDFTAGLKTILKPGGTITLEFPHLLRLIDEAQFDTVYHEHFSYLSLNTACRIFAKAGLRVWDVEEISTHGGSLRIYGCHQEDKRLTTEAVTLLLSQERAFGLTDLTVYQKFQDGIDHIKNNLLAFLIAKKSEGKRVMAYGAAAKGNTFLNYAGIKPDLLPMVFDAAPFKQGKFMPGSHIPIVKPELIRELKPDVVLILPWNIAEELISQMSCVREWGGKFVVAVPELKIF